LTPAWLVALLRAIRPLLPADFVGRIEINVFKGGVRNASVTHSFRLDDEPAPTAPAPAPRPPRRGGSMMRRPE
jgi:hypothetical protein